MNFDDAAKAHVNWKIKLRGYLAKPDKSLDPMKVAMDNQCDLGKWLHGEGVKFSSHATYKQLVAEHAKFHKAASDVIRRADSGQKIAEEVALGSKSEFAATSERVIQLIMTCSKECR
jgi:hypothetical protein